jgi:hypothetical protein
MDRLNLATTDAIALLQVEHRLAGLLSNRHQGGEIADGRQAERVGFDGRRWPGRMPEDVRAKCGRNRFRGDWHDLGGSDDDVARLLPAAIHLADQTEAMLPLATVSRSTRQTAGSRRRRHRGAPGPDDPIARRSVTHCHPAGSTASTRSDYGVPKQQADASAITAAVGARLCKVEARFSSYRRLA